MDDHLNIQVNKIEDEVKTLIEKLDEDNSDFLARKTQEEFTRYKSARIIQEQVWIRAHQNYKGVYPSDMDFSNGTSRAFVQATRPRVQTAISMLIPIILPTGDNAWTIDATPQPYMPKIVEALIAANTPPEEIRRQVALKAASAASAMTSKVSDGLVETNFNSIVIRSMLDLCLYGTSVIMGPMVNSNKEISEEDEKEEEPSIIKTIANRVKALITGGSSEEEYEEKYSPGLEVISPFDFYPDPGARIIEECDSVILRKVLNRAQIRDLREEDGFNKDKIDEMLEKFPDGNWSPESWESVVNTSNDQIQMNAPNGRFVCIVRWGYVSGKDLQKAGVDVPHDLLEEQVMANLWVIGNRVISARVSDLHRNRVPFYVTPYSVVPHTIWGAGVAEFMFDSQDAINACERAKMDNMAISSRPQVIVNVDRLAQGTNALEIRAGKIWATKESEINSQKPIEFFVPDCRLDQIKSVQQDAMSFAQEQTAMPNLLMGMGGEGIHNRTSSGASMQFNAAITPLKAVVFNIEQNLIIPLVTSVARFYATFSADPQIKGDYRVNARGVQGLMGREAVAQKVAQFMQFASQNQEWAGRVDLNTVFKLMVKDSGLENENIVIPDQVYEARKKEEQDQQNQMTTQQQQVQMQIANTPKPKAETSPKDAALELAKDATPYPKLQLALISQAIEMFGFNNPEIDRAVSESMELIGLQHEDQAHQMATNRAEREMPTPLLKQQMQQQHDLQMAQMPQGTGPELSQTPPLGTEDQETPIGY